LFYDFHVAAMLRHHVPLADEIIVNEGYSTDGTYEAISDIDPKITIFRSRWDQSNPDTWHRDFKNDARQRCTGDWCILLDCDELIPEWEFERLRTSLASTDKPLAQLRFTHFYGNYRVVIAKLPRIIPLLGTRIHRNTPEVEVWGDGARLDSAAGRRLGPLRGCVRRASFRDGAPSGASAAEMADAGEAA
jgi:glycosyltransferase involved in cell wall biosynthesis